MHFDRRLRNVVDPDPEGTERVRGGDVVLPVRKAGNAAPSVSDRGEEQRAVPDAFVRRDGDAADEGLLGGVDEEIGQSGGMVIVLGPRRQPEVSATAP